MSLDGMVTHALTYELQQIVGARIYKMSQPTSHDFMLYIRKNKINRKLLLSAHPTYPRAYFTERTFINPPQPPMFCILMRKHCDGGIIERVTQIKSERIIHFTVRTRNECGDESLKTVVLELTGRHSNVILLEQATSTIIDGIHHVTPAISRFRIVMPGYPYVAPPEQHKLNPFTIHEAMFHTLSREKLMAYQECSIASHVWATWFVQQFSGMSPRLANEIIWRACSLCIHTTAMIQNIEITSLQMWASFQHVRDEISNHRYCPTILTDQTGKTFFSVLAITHISGEIRTFETISECLECFYDNKAERDMIKQRIGNLFCILQQVQLKNIKKVKKLEATLREAKDAEQFRIMGELLLTSLHTVTKGTTEVVLPHLYAESGTFITIPLDLRLNAIENAQRYFKKYHKAKNSIPVVAEQIQSTQAENQYIETVLQQLQGATLQDAEEIREELVQQGYIRNRGRTFAAKPKNKQLSIYQYLSSEGIPIYVGKNNFQNEYITHRLAKANDTWLHTKHIPGPHVVIHSEQYGETTLEEAAQLAAHYSQAKHSSHIAVDYTLIRYVRKPNGAKPGFVIYQHEKTLFITPDPARIEKMNTVLK